MRKKENITNKQKKIKVENRVKNKNENNEEKQYEDQVEGRNAVLELLESGKDINKIFVEKGEKQGSINCKSKRKKNSTCRN